MGIAFYPPKCLAARGGRKWTFYRRDEQRITEVKQMFSEGW